MDGDDTSKKKTMIHTVCIVIGSRLGTLDKAGMATTYMELLQKPRVMFMRVFSDRAGSN